MSKIITTDNGRQYQTAGFAKTTGAVIAGGTVSSGIALASRMSARPLINKMKSLSESCDTDLVTLAVNKTFQNGPLPNKGVELKFVDETTEFFSLFDKKPKLILNPLEAIKFGDNACYSPLSKQIFINMKKLGLSAFHEMGHATNHNCSKLWSGIQMARMPLMSLSGLFAMTALLKRKKVEGEEPRNSFDKVTTFVKNNVGKLVTLAFVPIFAEELMASYRGNKMAAKVLPKEILKKVKVTNAFAAATYVTGAIAAGTAAYLASTVRDKIAKPKEI